MVSFELIITSIDTIIDQILKDYTHFVLIILDNTYY